MLQRSDVRITINIVSAIIYLMQKLLDTTLFVYIVVQLIPCKTLLGGHYKTFISVVKWNEHFSILAVIENCMLVYWLRSIKCFFFQSDRPAKMLRHDTILRAVLKLTWELKVIVREIEPWYKGERFKLIFKVHAKWCHIPGS